MWMAAIQSLERLMKAVYCIRKPLKLRAWYEFMQNLKMVRCLCVTMSILTIL